MRDLVEAMEEQLYYVYILANKRNTVLYVGVTNSLPRRIYEHKSHLIKGFTKRYNVNKLVYFEEFNDIREAIQHEKLLKRWKRSWKERLISQTNPGWKELDVN